MTTEGRPPEGTAPPAGRSANPDQLQDGGLGLRGRVPVAVDGDHRSRACRERQALVLGCPEAARLLTSPRWLPWPYKHPQQWSGYVPPIYPVTVVEVHRATRAERITEYAVESPQRLGLLAIVALAERVRDGGGDPGDDVQGQLA